MPQNPPPLSFTDEQLAALRHTIQHLPEGIHEAQAFDLCLGQPLRLAWRELWLQERVQPGPISPREENERLKRELAELKVEQARLQADRAELKAADLASSDEATRPNDE